jgi:hypothetical protein
VNQVTGRRLESDPPSLKPVRAPRPQSPRVASEIVLGRAKYDEVKKRRNDTDAIVDAIMGKKRLEESWKPKDPLEGLQIVHNHAVEDQRVVLPGGGGGERPEGYLEGVTDEDRRDAALRQQVPMPSEVLRRYKMFSVEGEHPKQADAINLLNPDAKNVGRVAERVSGASRVVEEHRKMQTGGTLTSYAPPEGARTAREHGLGSGAMTHALAQNRIGNADGVASFSVKRGGSGLVIGDVVVAHDYLLPASLVAAKWGRLAHTTYGKGELEPCRMRVELQPLYVESLVKDLETATGGRAVFTTEVSPAVFLLDIGTVNSAVHGHRASGVPPEPLELNVGGSYSVKGGTGPKQQKEDSSSEEEYKEVVKGENGAPDREITRRRRKRKLYEFGLSDAVTAVMTGKELVEHEWRNRRRTRTLRKPQQLTQEDIRRAELAMAVDRGKERANRLMFQFASSGDDKSLRRLLTEGFKTSYEPNPWYQVGTELEELKEVNKQRHRDSLPPFLSLADWKADITKQAKKKAEAEEKERRMKEAAAANNPQSRPPPSPEKDAALMGLVALAKRGGGGGGSGGSGDAGGGSSPKAKAGDVVSQQREGAFVKKKLKDVVPDIFVLPDLNITNSRGLTALMMAAKDGNVECVQELLRHGANYRCKNREGQSALDLAKANAGIASMALAAGVPFANNRKRRAAKLLAVLDDRSLNVAAQQGDMRRVTHLVNHEHHPVNVANEYGMTPLHFAVMRRDAPMAEFLVAEGADIHFENNLHQSPWSLASEDQNKSAKERLLAAMLVGKERAEREELRAKVVAESAARRAQQEAHLVRELKTITKGTSAARAVQLALSADAHADNTFGKVPGVAGLGIPLREQQRHPDVEKALRTMAAESGGGGGATPLRGSGSGLSAVLALHSPVSGATGVRAVPISRAEKDQAAQDLTHLTSSWSRHVLNYLAMDKAHAAVIDSAETRARGEMIDLANKERRRVTATLGARRETMGASPLAGGGKLSPAMERTGPLTARQERADAEFRQALDHPERVDEDKLRVVPVPAAESRRFEAWYKMRGLG